MVDGGANVASRTSYREDPKDLASLSTFPFKMIKQVALQTFRKPDYDHPSGWCWYVPAPCRPYPVPAWPCPRQEAHWYRSLGRSGEWTLGLLGQAWSPTWLFRGESGISRLTCLLGTVSFNGNSLTAVVSDPGIYAGLSDTSGCCM